MSDYTVELTFVTNVEAPNDTVAKQAARKVANAVNDDAANSMIDLESIDVTEQDS